jgi:pyridinium-3,5-bisthiocarboxylic acid mononucleotide nickel chelatase
MTKLRRHAGASKLGRGLGLRGHGHSHGPKPFDESAREALPRGAGTGKLLYLDAGSGLAGDMLVAALVDLGVPIAAISAGLAGVAVRGYQLEFRHVFRSAMRGCHLDVQVAETQPSRDYASIVALLHAATSLSEGARQLALAAFEKLGRAEAQIHGTTLEQVHFHEVGAVDSIVDITAAAIAFDYLGASVACSPLPMGRGQTRSAHGVIPLPAPATVLCLAGVPTYDAGLPEELVTPTGACLAVTAASVFSDWPAFSPERVGVGAGTKEFPDRPNILRAVLGTPAPASLRSTTRSDGQPPLARRTGSHTLIETNVDDMSPEVAAFAIQRAFAAGALDVWTTPIGMKKGRAAITLSALAANENVDAIIRVLLSETSSIGVRLQPVDRVERPRRMLTVETQYGRIELKVAGGDGLPDQVSPEYESCRQAAETHQIPIRRVYNAALAAYLKADSGD